MFDRFDFSDFGSPPTPMNSNHPGSAGSGIALQPAISDTGFSTGSDPFAGDSAPRQTSPTDACGASAPGPDRGLVVARPPLTLFGFAFALAAVGVAIAGVWGGAVVPAAVGWFLAGQIAIGLLGVYTLVDTWRRADAVYSAPRWTGTAYWAVVVVSMAGIAFGAVHLALWAGRL